MRTAFSLMFLLASTCIAQDYLVTIRYRDADGVILEMNTGAVKPAPGCTVKSVSCSVFTSEAADSTGVISVLRFSEGKVLLRDPVDLEAERAATNKRRSAHAAVEAKAQSLAAQELLKDDPKNQVLLDEKTALDKQSADATALTTK